MFWDQFEEYDSHSLRSVKQLSEKIKGHRLEKYKSKFLTRTDLKKRLKDNSDAPKARLGILPKIFTSSKKRRKLHSIRLLKNGLCQPDQP